MLQAFWVNSEGDNPATSLPWWDVGRDETGFFQTM